MSNQEKIEFADSVLKCLEIHNSQNEIDALLSFFKQDNWQDAKDGVRLSIYGFAINL